VNSLHILAYFQSTTAVRESLEHGCKLFTTFDNVSPLSISVAKKDYVQTNLIVNYIGAHPSPDNIRIIEGNLVALNKKKFSNLYSIYNNAFNYVEYGVPRVFSIRHPVVREISATSTITAVDDFKESGPEYRRAVRFRSSVFQLEFKLGSVECNEFIKSLVQSPN
jgi:hypothetical protein